jgi:hypothetical protein
MTKIFMKEDLLIGECHLSKWRNSTTCNLIVKCFKTTNNSKQLMIILTSLDSNNNRKRMNKIKIKDQNLKMKSTSKSFKNRKHTRCSDSRFMNKT